MSITGVGSASALMVHGITDLRARLDELQRQLGTGKKADTYAGLGLDRGMAVGLRARLSAVGSYEDTVNTVKVRLDLAQTALTGIDTIARDIKSATQQSAYDLDGTGQSTAQRNANYAFDDLLGLLNTKVGDRYMFSGRTADKPAVETRDHIFNGDGARAGLKTLIAQRNMADLGASGLGRLEFPGAVGAVMSFNEDVAGSPFGFKLSTVTSGLTNALITGPGGAPATTTVDLTAGNPNAGETISLAFNLPDGSTETITLTARAAASSNPHEFTIGATPDDTADNLNAVLSAAVGKLARTALSAASAIAAADDFFNIDAANPPRRVAGPPYDSATALVAGTPADTVTWYTAEAGSDPARSTMVARIDESLTVAYGMRANEQGILRAVQNIAVFAATTFSASNPDDQDEFLEMNSRLTLGLSDVPGKQDVADIVADILTVQATLQSTKERHVQTESVLTNLLERIEGAPIEEVAAKVLALDTRLQATMQVTAMLQQTSLVNYL
jgi:flagellin-like hook-associated protein FlgL